MEKEVMTYHVYVLQSETSGRLYIGQTQDLFRRLQEHNSGQSESTRGRGPWRLYGQKAFKSRKHAVQFELRLKRLKRPERVLQTIISG